MAWKKMRLTYRFLRRKFNEYEEIRKQIRELVREVEAGNDSGNMPDKN